MKQDACNIYDSEVRNKMLKQLPHGNTITQEEILEIEKNTRDQSSNDQWFDERKKRLTASNFGAVIKRKKSIHPKSLLEKIHNQHRQSNPPAPCKWGLDKEENAIKAYHSFKKQEGKLLVSALDVVLLSILLPHGWVLAQISWCLISQRSIILVLARSNVLIPRET